MDKHKRFAALRSSKSHRDLTAPAKEYPRRKEDYELIETCGRGITATVWRAHCLPFDEEVAVKILDMENLNCKIEEMIHEANAMCMYHHPNVLRLYTAFVVGKHLWFIEPFVTGGSVYNIMKFKHPTGLDEHLIAIIIREVARALEYVHRSGGIHRDVKAGNILINMDGSVFLADFGVAATIERGGSWGNTMVNRKTFVGTPCWMAPEVMEQTSGYNSKADIWSFGITMLELAHGHAPFAKLPPMKVLLMTIQNEPPTLEAEFDHRHFSKNMRELVAQCLQKDPAKRPTAAQILESKFFKNIPDSKYLATHLVDGLPNLASREKMVRDRRASMTDEEEEDSAKMKEEYIRGMSNWDFGDILSIKDSSANGVSVQGAIGENKREGAKEKADALIEEKLSAEIFEKTQDATSSTKQEVEPHQPSESVFSPTKKLTESHNDMAGETTKPTSHEKNGKPSRFSITTRKEPQFKKSPFVGPADPGTAVAEMHSQTSTLIRSHSRGEGVASSSAIDLTEHDKEPHESFYNKGRFKVCEKVLNKEDAKHREEGKSEKLRATNSANSQIPVGNSFIPQATALLEQLQYLLQAQKSMSNNLEHVVDALKEAEKGNPNPLQTLLATNVLKEPQPPQQESQESLISRIEGLETENKTLKERITQLEKQVSNTIVGNGASSEKH